MSDFPAMEYKPVDVEEQIELAPGETSLDFMQKIYRSPRQPMARRMKAAEYALQFEHPKLGVMATAALNGQDFASVLERAIRRRELGAPLKLIEGGKSEAQE
jgi:hypothetical protein